MRTSTSGSRARLRVNAIALVSVASACTAPNPNFDLPSSGGGDGSTTLVATFESSTGLPADESSSTSTTTGSTSEVDAESTTLESTGDDTTTGTVIEPVAVCEHVFWGVSVGDPTSATGMLLLITPDADTVVHEYDGTIDKSFAIATDPRDGAIYFSPSASLNQLHRYDPIARVSTEVALEFSTDDDLRAWGRADIRSNGELWLMSSTGLGPWRATIAVDAPYLLSEVVAQFPADSYYGDLAFADRDGQSYALVVVNTAQLFELDANGGMPRPIELTRPVEIPDDENLTGIAWTGTGDRFLVATSTETTTEPEEDPPEAGGTLFWLERGEDESYVGTLVFGHSAPINDLAPAYAPGGDCITLLEG